MNAKLLESVSGTRCETFRQVLAKLEAIENALGERDGLRWFTRLYKAMTAEVAEQASKGAFKDPTFLERLDCAFAELYFDAIALRLRNPGAEPRAWTPLFDARDDARVSPLQFALAGVNAHINRDLPVALVQSFHDAGSEPQRHGARYADYLFVNQVLATVHEEAKVFLFSGSLVHFDDALGQADDVFEIWSLERARDAAWIAAEVQWQLAPAPFLARQHLDSLDRLVGCTGRNMLHRLLGFLSA
jgi:Family of unknown function (DUF5995)